MMIDSGSRHLATVTQVEYAMEAISHAGAAVGVLSKEGVVLAAEKKIMSKVRARAR
jgi:20S proteasome alpha/beta subunit